MKNNALVGNKVLWLALVGALAASAGGCAGADGEGGDEGAAEASVGLAMEADIVSNDLGPDNVQKKHASTTSGAATQQFSGLAMEADIVSNDLGPDNVQKKHLPDQKLGAEAGRAFARTPRVQAAGAPGAL